MPNVVTTQCLARLHVQAAYSPKTGWLKMQDQAYMSPAHSKTHPSLASQAMSSDSIAPKSFGEIIDGADNDSLRIQAFCQDRWNASDCHWKTTFVADGFEGLQPDPILTKLLRDPSYEDPRNNLTIWARPTSAVTDLAVYCQRELQKLDLGKALPGDK